MKRLLMGWLVLLLAGSAIGGSPAPSERIEASRLVDGTIGITPTGTVLAYTLDRPERLQPVVKEAIAKSVPQWTFRPVLLDRKPVAAKAPMHLRLVASPRADGAYDIHIASAYFGDQSSSVMQRGEKVAPRYPAPALRARLGGTVYLLLRIDRDGHVAEAIARQVNLGAHASERVLTQWRALFAESPLRAARQWTFSPAATGDPAYRIVTAPVRYELHELNARPKDAYGQWESYVPGPVEPAPWFDADNLLSAGTDAVPADGIFSEPSLRLLTPLARS